MHADQCSVWLLDDEEQPCEIYGGTSSEVEKTTVVQELTGHQHKAALKGKKLPSTCQQKFGP